MSTYVAQTVWRLIYYNASLIINDISSITGFFSKGPPCGSWASNFPVCVLWRKLENLRYKRLLSNSRYYSEIHNYLYIGEVRKKSTVWMPFRHSPCGMLHDSPYSIRHDSPPRQQMTDRRRWPQTPIQSLPQSLEKELRLPKTYSAFSMSSASLRDSDIKKRNLNED